MAKKNTNSMDETERRCLDIGDEMFGASEDNITIIIINRKDVRASLLGKQRSK